MIGKQLGQFHSDFEDHDNQKALGSIRFIGLSKKLYVDQVLYEDLHQHEHIRMRGVPTRIVRKTALDLKIGIIEMYSKMYNGEKYSYDLAGYQEQDDGDNIPCFEYNAAREVCTKESFIRVIGI